MNCPQNTRCNKNGRFLLPLRECFPGRLSPLEVPHVALPCSQSVTSALRHRALALQSHMEKTHSTLRQRIPYTCCEVRTAPKIEIILRVCCQAQPVTNQFCCQENVIASFSLKKTREVCPEVSPDSEIKLYGALSSVPLSQWARDHLRCKESAQSVWEQPTSVAGAALTGGGSDQTGEEELELFQRTVQIWCAAQ